MARFDSELARGGQALDRELVNILGLFDRPACRQKKTVFTPRRQERQEERAPAVTPIDPALPQFGYRLEKPWRLGALA
jgi:hypothetical protein